MSKLSSRRNICGHLEFYDENDKLVKIQYNENVTMFYKDGEFHREDGPAVMDPNTEAWYLNGKLHRLDGPALTYFDHGAPVQRFWVQNGLNHRTDGPAIEHLEEHRKQYDEYYISGKKVSKEEFEG